MPAVAKGITNKDKVGFTADDPCFRDVLLEDYYVNGSSIDETKTKKEVGGDPTLKGILPIVHSASRYQVLLHSLFNVLK